MPGRGGRRGGVTMRRGLPRRVNALMPITRDLINEVSESLQSAACTSRLGQSRTNPEIDETQSEAGIVYESTRNDETGLFVKAHTVANVSDRNTPLYAEVDLHGHRLDELDKLIKKLDKLNARLLTASNKNAAVAAQHQDLIGKLQQDMAVVETRHIETTEGMIGLEKRLDIHSNRLETISENIDLLNTGFKKLTVSTLAGQAPQEHIRPQMRLDLPTFSAAPYDRPVHFIRSFTNYLEATRVPRDSWHLVVDQALRGPAHDWWVYVCEAISTVAQFRDRFLSKYWNRAAQDKVRQELEFGYYRAESNLSKSEYAIRLYNMVIMLDDPPSDRSIVEKFARHFDEQIQQATLMRNLTKMDDFLGLLENTEQAGMLNASRNATFVDFHPHSQDARRGFDPTRRYVAPGEREPRFNRSNERSEWRGRSPGPPQMRNEHFRSSTPRPYDNRPEQSRGNSSDRRNENSARSNDSRSSQPTLLRRTNSIPRVNEINVENEVPEIIENTEN